MARAAGNSEGGEEGIRKEGETHPLDVVRTTGKYAHE